VPADPFVVLIAVPAEAAAVEDVAGAAAVAACELELLELPHPATIKAAVASAATPARYNFGVLRLVIVAPTSRYSF
jgi:hypothetical protein